jgi:peptidylprolyl isomerase
MRRQTFTAAVLAAAALAAAGQATAAAPDPAPAAAQPTAADWRTPDPNDVLVIDTNRGRIVVELAPEVAPQFVARVQELARQHFYDGQAFFRVIDDFMDQTGDPKNDGTGGSQLPNVPSEFVFRRGAGTPFVTVLTLPTGEVGFINSLPAASQTMELAPLTRDGKVVASGMFCAGVAGAARSDDPDSANSQFFLMRATNEKLELRYAPFGRVISGMDVVRAIKTGEPVADPQDRMARVRLLADLPPAERPKVRVVDPKGPWFQGELARVRAQQGAVFSACDVNIPAEVR